jgi:hypothetical protein
MKNEKKSNLYTISRVEMNMRTCGREGVFVGTAYSPAPPSPIASYPPSIEDILFSRSLPFLFNGNLFIRFFLLISFCFPSSFPIVAFFKIQQDFLSFMYLYVFSSPNLHTVPIMPFPPPNNGHIKSADPLIPPSLYFLPS